MSSFTFHSHNMPPPFHFSPAGKHTASTHRLSALVTPAGRSYVCTAQQTLTLISSDHQKGITVSMYDIQIQPFDIASDFMFSERKSTTENPFDEKLPDCCHTHYHAFLVTHFVEQQR